MVHRVQRYDQFRYKNAWSWTAIGAGSKLVPSFMIGVRSTDTPAFFMSDFAFRLSHRVRLTTDAHKAYLEAAEGAFEIDYAMLVKIYGEDPQNEKRYSPERCISAEKLSTTGNPDHSKISTSYVERQNLTMRMSG
jgi:hypothetical protein